MDTIEQRGEGGNSPLSPARPTCIHFITGKPTTGSAFHELLVDRSGPTVGVEDGTSSDELLADRTGPTAGREDVSSSDELLLDRTGPMVGVEDVPSSDEFSSQPGDPLPATVVKLL
jgi:hypothetical protein